MKKKLLFYGSCHLSAVSQWIEENYSHKFEIVDCRKAGVAPFWRKEKDKNFALWSPENQPLQNELKENVYKELNNCDVFVFQPHEFKAVMPELKTSFLIKNVFNGPSVCLPNTRMTVYPIGAYTSLDDIIQYVKNNVSHKAKEIIYYLKTEDDPSLVKIINESIKKQEAGNVKSKESIEHSVCMLDYIENNWKTELLFCTHTHPTIFYYQELIRRLFKFLGEELPVVSNIEYPKTSYFINPLQFKFFQRLFPHLQIPANIELRDLNEEYLHFRTERKPKDL